MQLWLAAFALAQPPDSRDSLRKVLTTLKDTARIDCLIQLSIEYLFKQQADSLLYFANAAYDESKRINYIHGIAESFGIKGALESHLNVNPEEGKRLSLEALKWFALTGNKKNIEIQYYHLANILLLQNKFDEAGLYAEQSYSWAEKNGSLEWMTSSLTLLYENYRESGDFDKAFDAFERTQALYQSQNNKKDTVNELYILGELYRRIENYPVALNYYKEFIKFIDIRKENRWLPISYGELFALNNIFDSALYYYNLVDTADSYPNVRFFLISKGEYHLLLKDYQTALQCLKLGLEYSRKAKDLSHIKRALIAISKTYIALQKDSVALSYVREGLDISLRTKAKHFIKEAYQVLYTIFERKEMADSAYLYYKLYIQQKELVANDMVKGRFAAYSYEQKIISLDKEKQLQQQKITQASWHRNFLIAGIIAIIFIGIIFFRSMLLKRKNEAHRREIAEGELKLQKLESEKARAELQQEATELEMQALRAQMNPHFIFNCLSSINRFILKNEPDTASDYLTKFSRLIRMVLNNSKKDSILLEDELEMLRLYLDLERLRFKNAFDYSIIFHNNFDAASVYIPPLLLQPFAENAIWHGLMNKESKGLLEIAFTLDENILNCSITDNGVGRKKAEALKSKSAEKQKSLGMQITAQRLALLNKNIEESTFDIEDLTDENGKPNGTRVILKIRYKERSKEFIDS